MQAGVEIKTHIAGILQMFRDERRVCILMRDVFPA